MKRTSILALAVAVAMLAGTLLPAAAQSTTSSTQALNALVKIPARGVTVPPLCVTVGSDTKCGPSLGQTIGGQIELITSYVMTTAQQVPKTDLRAGLGIACTSTETGDGLVARITDGAFKRNSLVTAVLKLNGEVIQEVNLPVDSQSDPPNLEISWCGFEL